MVDQPPPSRGRSFLRLLAGFVLAPLAPLVALAGIDILLSGFDPGGTLLIFIIGAPGAYGAMLVFGVPAVAVARWLRWGRLWIYLMGGLSMGLLVAVIFAIADPGDVGIKEALVRGLSGLLPFAASCGFLVSAVFWLVTRPDRFDGGHEKSSVASSAAPGLVSTAKPGGDDATRQ